MSGYDQAQYILMMPLGELKALRKAMNVMLRAGFHREEALKMLISAHAAQKAARLNR